MDAQVEVTQRHTEENVGWMYGRFWSWVGSHQTGEKSIEQEVRRDEKMAPVEDAKFCLESGGRAMGLI